MLGSNEGIYALYLPCRPPSAPHTHTHSDCFFQRPCRAMSNASSSPSDTQSLISVVLGSETVQPLKHVMHASTVSLRQKAQQEYPRLLQVQKCGIATFPKLPNLGRSSRKTPTLAAGVKAKRQESTPVGSPRSLKECTAHVLWGGCGL